MKREWIGGALVGCVPALMAGGDPRLTLPAVHGGADPLAQAAHLAHAVRHVPGTEAFWDAPWMAPVRFAQLFLDPMVGPSIVARLVPGSNPALDYHVVLWFTVGAAFVAMTWCARRFGIGRSFAAMAGLSYAIGPYAAGHFHHLNQVPSPWLPLALGATVDLARAHRPWRATGLFLVAFALQLSWSVYATAALALAAVVVVAVVGGRAVPGRPLLAASLGAAAVLVVGGIPYVLAGRAVEGYGREATEALAFQARWFDAWKAAGPRLLPVPTHDALRPSLYPGIGLALLAGLGIWRLADRRAVAALVTVIVVGVGCAFGRTFLVPFTDLEIPLPYMVLQEVLWPLRALRDPSRFALVAAWAGALLAAGGAQWLVARKRVLGVAVLVIAALDAAPGPMDRIALDVDVPVVDALDALPDGALWIGIPAACDETRESARDARFMHWALASGTRVAGGATGFVPPAIVALRRATCDEVDVTALEAYGVRWVVTDGAVLVDPHWTDGTWSVIGVADLSAVTVGE